MSGWRSLQISPLVHSGWSREYHPVSDSSHENVDIFFSFLFSFLCPLIWQVSRLVCSTSASPGRVAYNVRANWKKLRSSSGMLTISFIFRGRVAFCLQTRVCVCVCVWLHTLEYCLVFQLDKYHEMTDLYGRAVRVWYSKDQFQMVNKAWTRETSQKKYHKTSFSILNSPVDMQPIVVPLFQFAHHVTMGTMCSHRGGGQAGAVAPDQVRRELITFRCCFSTLYKEQSVLISVHY